MIFLSPLSLCSDLNKAANLLLQICLFNVQIIQQDLEPLFQTHLISTLPW